MIISLLNQKGGVGKTTLSINLAGYFTEKGKKVVLIDADEQESALDWVKVREKEFNFTVIGMSKPIIHREVKKFTNDYDIIIIDGTPRKDEVAKSAIAASDIVLIPVMPSPVDIRATPVIVGYVKELQLQYEEHKNIRAFFIINGKKERAKINKDISESLNNFGFPTLKSEISDRDIFARSFDNGLTVMEEPLKPNNITSDLRGRSEIESLGKEIESL